MKTDIFQDYITLNRSSVKNFVFVMAASENHTKPLETCLNSVMEYFDGRKIIFYDLGIKSQERIKKVNRNASILSTVRSLLQVKTWNFLFFLHT